MTSLDLARSLAASNRPSDVALGVAMVTRSLTDDDPATCRQGWPLNAETVRRAADYLGVHLSDGAVADVLDTCPRVSDAMLNRS